VIIDAECVDRNGARLPAAGIEEPCQGGGKHELIARVGRRCSRCGLGRGYRIRRKKEERTRDQGRPSVEACRDRVRACFQDQVGP